MNKITKTGIALALVAYFLFLVVSNIPAQLAVVTIHNAVPNLWLTEVNGSVWKGRAGSSQIDINRNSAIALGEINWSLRPLSLLTLSPCVDFTTDLKKQKSKGSACYSLLGGEASLRETEIEAPVAVLDPLITPFKASGNLSLNIAQARLKGSTVLKLDARGSWQSGRVYDGHAWWYFGTYATKAVDTEQGGVMAEIFDIDAMYSLNGSGQWSANEGWSVQGKVKAKEGAPLDVVQTIELIGEDQGDGYYFIRWPL